MKLRFLTWNVKNNNKKIFYEDLNCQLKKDAIDFLILQECHQHELVHKLEEYTEIVDFEDGSGQRYVRLFIKNESNLNYSDQTAYMNNKMRCIKITFSTGFVLNIAGVHFYAEAGKSPQQQSKQNAPFPKFVREYEIKSGSSNTLIIGDFNHRPFDINWIDTDFFNATNDREIIRLFKTRTLQTNSHPFYYNPMWNLLGDYNYQNDRPKTTGSYYWYADDVAKYSWNLIDGVILSADIMDCIDIKSLQIITEINDKELIKKTFYKVDESLLTDGFSDHLPIRFTINI